MIFAALHRLASVHSSQQPIICSPCGILWIAPAAVQNDGGDPHATMSACQHPDVAAAQALAAAVRLAAS